MLVKNRVLCVGALSLALLFSVATMAEGPKVIPSGAKVYIAPMDGFESYLKEAIEKKKVPLVVVDNEQDAEYEISGVASSQKASVAKRLFLGVGTRARKLAFR